MTPPDKASLRAEALARRAAMTAAERADASHRAAEYLLPRLPRAPGIVALFMPIGDEIDTGPVIAALHARGVALALPVVVNRRSPLIFRRWAPGEQLVPRQWGIREPLDTAEAVDPGTLICPLAVFDDALNRIGYGAGHYDRSLAALRALKPVLAVGYAFACQRAQACPTEPHDERLDAVVTEAGVIPQSFARST